MTKHETVTHPKTAVTHFMLGRLPRAHDPRIPHLSALLAGKTLPPPPAQVDYTKGMPKNLGMMMNDTLGDCTCAAFYHALQVWSFNASKRKSIDTEPDGDVEKLYELACGYKPSQGGEGPGGNEQHVLKYLLTKGAPMGPTAPTVHKIDAFVEVDPRNTDDVKRAINELRRRLYRLQRAAIHRPDHRRSRRRYGTSRTADTQHCRRTRCRPRRLHGDRRARHLVGTILHDDLGVLRQICRRDLRHRRHRPGSRAAARRPAGSPSPSSSSRCRRSKPPDAAEARARLRRAPFRHLTAPVSPRLRR